MSYILEALRRAESERERKRGGVPGLHAQPVPSPSPDDLGERRGAPWGWIVSGLSIGVLLMILWRGWSVEPLVDEAELARAPVGGNVSQGSVEPPAASAGIAGSCAERAGRARHGRTANGRHGSRPHLQPTRHRRLPRRRQPTKRHHASPSPRRRRATPRPRQRRAATDAPRADARAAGSAPAPQPAANARNPVPAPAPPPERLRTLAELPDDLRSSVPQLAFGGSVYSDTPAQRMVIFNGQVLREGDAVTNELQIEQIRPRSAVLRVRGQRFEMPF